MTKSFIITICSAVAGFIAAGFQMLEGNPSSAATIASISIGTLSAAFTGPGSFSKTTEPTT